jgi:hypothetical protein
MAICCAREALSPDADGNAIKPCIRLNRDDEPLPVRGAVSHESHSPPNRGSDLSSESTQLLDLSVVTSARVSLLLCV